jgi:hypothetical protein
MPFFRHRFLVASYLEDVAGHLRAAGVWVTTEVRRGPPTDSPAPPLHWLRDSTVWHGGGAVCLQTCP